MKKQLFKISFVLTTLFSLVLFSCETDTGSVIPATTNGPSASLMTGTGIINQDASVTLGTEFSVNLVSAQGDKPLKVLTVQEAGVTIPLERIKINGVAVSSNPILLFNADKTKLDYKITVKAHSDVSVKTYSFVVEDEAGKKETKSLAITTVGVAPTVELKSADSLGLAPNALFSTTFKVTKGSAALKTIEVQENGVKIADLSRLYYDKITQPFTANPQTVLSEDKNAFAKSIIINSPAMTGKYVYTFIFTDETGLTKSSKVTVSVGSNVEVIVGALLNSAGPDGTGGLDLDTGKETGSTSTTSKLRDEGIDLGETLANNWKQQVSGVNGSIVRYVVKGKNGVADTFTFAGVNTKEEVASLFAKGVDFTQKNGTRLISNKMVTGDVLIVQNGTKYYLLSIKSVNVTKADNDDKYTIDIKK